MKRSSWVLTCLGGAFVLVVGAAYGYATGGFDDTPPVPDWLYEPAIAHRGLHTGDSVRPENSLAAFQAAADAGYAIELDAQVTSDGTVVVMHDDNLKRMTGDSRSISGLPLATVQGLRLLESTATVPTLRQVFDVVGGRVPIFVEVKNRGTVGALEDAVAREVATYRGPVAVMSFNPLSLARIAEKTPGVPRGQLSGTLAGENLSFLTKLALTQMLMNWKSRPQFVAYELKGLPSVGTWLQRRRGRPLVVWTATTPADRERARRYGDNVVFELAGRPAK